MPRKQLRISTLYNIRCYSIMTRKWTNTSTTDQSGPFLLLTSRCIPHTERWHISRVLRTSNCVPARGAFNATRSRVVFTVIRSNLQDNLLDLNWIESFRFEEYAATFTIEGCMTYWAHWKKEWETVMKKEEQIERERRESKSTSLLNGLISKTTTYRFMWKHQFFGIFPLCRLVSSEERRSL